MQTSFSSAFGDMRLQRYPFVHQQNLQAWDASDEYVLDHVKQHPELIENRKVLIFNDTFGALSLSLCNYSPTIVTDSFISEKAIHQNALLNDINALNLDMKNSLDELSDSYDLVIIKIPKTLDFFRYFLAKIAPHLHQDSQIICAGMVKSMPRSVWNIMELMLGQTTTSLAKKKARLIFAKPQKTPRKITHPTYFTQEKTNYQIYNHANVFSQNSLDIGTRFLLDNLPHFSDINNIIDLGCGNGIVGLNLAKQYPNAHITFCDESYMAVASAKLTVQANHEDTNKHHFLVNNCLDSHMDCSTDLIVCNPPFHQSYAIGLHIAQQMFKQSQLVLKKGGHLIVIANRHLPYFQQLKKYFYRAKNIASNRKFCLYHMTK